jgi:hypothetical protein
MAIRAGGNQDASQTAGLAAGSALAVVVSAGVILPSYFLSPTSPRGVLNIEHYRLQQQLKAEYQRQQ